MIIPDPTLYGPPTLSQCLLEMVHAQCADLAESYKKAAEPHLRVLERWPDDRGAIERLAELDHAHRRDRQRLMAGPYLKVMMMEPLGPWLVSADGTWTPIEQRVPMMGERIGF